MGGDRKEDEKRKEKEEEWNPMEQNDRKGGSTLLFRERERERERKWGQSEKRWENERARGGKRLKERMMMVMRRKDRV